MVVAFRCRDGVADYISVFVVEECGDRDRRDTDPTLGVSPRVDHNHVGVAKVDVELARQQIERRVCQSKVFTTKIATT